MPYLVCYKCDVYYEVETEEEIMELTHCECGEKLIYFMNLEDSYSDDVGGESFYEALNVADGVFVHPDNGKHGGNGKPDEYDDPEYGKGYDDHVDFTRLPQPGTTIDQEPSAHHQHTRETTTTFTPEKASQYLKIQEHGQLLTYAGVILFILSLFAIFSTLNLFYGLLTLVGVFLGVYGNSLIENGKAEGSSWQNGLEGENMVAEYLNTLPQDYYVYQDVNLPGKGGNIDHIVIGPTGIFVIETKNYSGKYRIKGNQWLYYKNGAPMVIDNNPGTQVRKNTLDLINFLQDKGISTNSSWITGLVAFICQDFQVLETPRNYKVLIPQTVPEYIMNGKKETNMDLLRRAALELEPYCV